MKWSEMWNFELWRVNFDESSFVLTPIYHLEIPLRFYPLLLCENVVAATACSS